MKPELLECHKLNGLPQNHLHSMLSSAFECNLQLVWQSSDRLLLSFICQNHDKVQQQKCFSFNHILCSYILLFISGTLKSAYIHHPNTQMPCRNWIHSVDMAANCMFPWTSVTVNHTQYVPALQVSAEQCWGSFGTAAHCRELGLHVFNKWFTDECI